MNVKKLLALLLAAMMVLGTVSALADPATVDTTFDVPITQTLYFKNVEASKVYEPNLYYTYTITPGEAGATVKDHAGNQVTVKAGDMRGFGLTTATGSVDFGINFSSDHKLVQAAADGKAAVTKKVTVSFDGSKILSADDIVVAGVYRYIITQTTSTTQKNNVGVTEVGTQDKTLVLDVYVKNTGEVPGAVILDPNTDDNPDVDNSGDPNSDGSEDNKDDKEGKTTGFGDPEGDDDFEEEDPADVTPDDPTKPAGDEDDPDTQKTKFTTPSELPNYYDLYTTYNVTVAKEVTGDMGDKANYFPFQTDISNSIPGAAFTYSVTNNGSKNVAETKAQLIATAGTKTLGSATATVADGFAIKHEGKINLIGVPSVISTTDNVSILANEFNNTENQYKVTATNFGIAADTPVNKETATTGTTAASFKDDTANTTFTVTNKLDNISPTGVVLRFAPYFAMMVGGIALLIVFFTRRRKEEEE